MAVSGDDRTEGVYNMVAKQGETFDRSFVYRDDNGAVINLSGYSAAMKVRKFYPATSLQAAYSDAAVVSISSGTGEITLTALTGQVDISIPSATTAAVPPGTYNYDIELTSGGGEVYKIARGFFDVEAEATY